MPEDLLIPSIPHWLYKGDTALHLAAAALNEASVKILLKAGADPNAVNRRGATPLHYACDPRPVSERGPQAIVLGLLIDADADLDHADKGGATPLHRAVRSRSPEAVRCLLDAGASATVTLGKQRSTPLHLAVHSTGAGGTAGAHREQLDIIRLLLKHGADPKIPDASGKSALAGARNDHVRDALR
jgi:ankyrin repeat protein